MLIKIIKTKYEIKFNSTKIYCFIFEIENM